MQYTFQINIVSLMTGMKHSTDDTDSFLVSLLFRLVSFNCLIMVSVLTWSAVHCRFAPRSDQIKDYSIGICTQVLNFQLSFFEIVNYWINI